MQFKQVIGILILCALISASDCVTSTTLQLTKESFTIESKVHVIARQEDGSQYIAEVSEAYSVEQKRAKLSLLIASDVEYDQQYQKFWYEPGQLIMFNSGTGECTISESPKAVSQGLKYDMFDLEISNVPDYIIGFARLLFFIDEHKNELKLRDLSKTTLVRNIPCLMYSFDYTDKRAQKLSLQVYYSGSSKGLLEQQLPVRVNITSETESIVIEYSRVQLLKIDFFSKALSETSNMELMDDFQVTTSCAYIMRPVKLFSQQDLYSRLSFESEVRSGTDLEYRMGKEQVLEVSGVYDSRLGLMRLKRDRTPTSQSILYKTLDFNKGMSYRAEESGPVGESVVTDCLVYKTNRNLNVSMGQVLLGGDDFVYLGRGKYRGLNTKVYKSKVGKLPLWLENPIEYTTLDRLVKVHYSNKKSDGSISIVSIIVHLSDQEIPVPILMILNQDGCIQRINFFNFVWDIHHSTRDLFSLANMCSSQSKRAQIEMVLEADNDEIAKQVTLPNSHFETSLLGLLSSGYSLPVVMVNSLELRKLGSDIIVSFVVADHQKEVSDFTLVGYGNLAHDYKSDNMKVYKRLITFNRCAQIATKTSSEVTFGWSQRLHACIVEKGYKTKATEITSFKMCNQIDSDYEVFAVRQHRDNSKLRVSMQWLDEIYWIKRKLLSDKLSLNINASTTSALPFHVEKFVSTTTNMLDTHQNESSLAGLGLTKNERNSWEVKSKDVVEQSGNKIQTAVGAMSLYECRSRCLENPQCQSYSVCQRSMELECINSRHNFTRLKMIPKLLDDGPIVNASQREVFNMEIEGEQVSFTRRPYCSIYNKLYMDLYRSQSSVSMVVFPGSLLDAYSREECAKRCFQINADVLNEDSKIMLRISTIYLSYLPKQDLDELHQLLAERMNIKRKICNGFYFVPHDSISTYNSGLNIDRFLSDPDSARTKDIEGYCKLDQSKLVSVDGSDGNFMRISFIYHYAYRFDHLYQSFAGVRLKPSPLTKDQEQTYLYHSNGKAHKDSNQPLVPIRNLLDAGYNFQRILSVPEKLTCASVCLSGRMGPWPYCKSYDIELDESSNAVTCYLNSITLMDAMNSESFNLVDETKEKGKLKFHYEPLDSALVESIEGKEMRVLEQEEETIVSSSFRINGLLSFIISILVMVGCGYLGLHIAGQVIKKRNEDQSRLMIDVDFINLVSAEGSIR